MPLPTDSIKNFKRSQMVILAGVVVFLIALFMPTPEGMSASGQRLLAVVLLMGVWWMGEGASVTVTALVPLVLFPVFDIMSSKEVAVKYVNHFTFLFFGGFLIAIAMERWNFHKRLALNIISFVGTRPERIVLGFMVATAFLSMWISNTASTMMMLPVAMAVVGQVAREASFNGERNAETESTIRKNLGLVLMLALAYSASIGGVGTLIGTAPNIVFAGFYKQFHPELPEITFFSVDDDRVAGGRLIFASGLDLSLPDSLINSPGQNRIPRRWRNYKKRTTCPGPSQPGGKNHRRGFCDDGVFMDIQKTHRPGADHRSRLVQPVCPAGNVARCHRGHGRGAFSSFVPVERSAGNEARR